MWGNDLVSLTIVEAKEIRACNLFSNTSDAYVLTQLKTTIPNRCNNNCLYTLRQSAIVKKTLAPVWKETLCFNLSTQPFMDMIVVTVFAKSTIGSDRALGRVDIPVSLLAAFSNSKVDAWFKLQEPRGKLDTNVAGLIRLQLQFVPNGALNSDVSLDIPVPSSNVVSETEPPQQQSSPHAEIQIPPQQDLKQQAASNVKPEIKEPEKVEAAQQISNKETVDPRQISSANSKEDVDSVSNKETEQHSMYPPQTYYPSQPYYPPQQYYPSQPYYPAQPYYPPQQYYPPHPYFMPQGNGGMYPMGFASVPLDKSNK